MLNRQNEEILDFCEFWFNFKPHFYQKDFLTACIRETRIAGKWCRQSGKSHSVAAYVLYKCLTSNHSFVITAPSQSQSTELYNKIKDFINSNPLIGEQLTKDTASEMRFKTGARVVALPCGPEGKTIRGHTGDTVIIEEAEGVKDSIVNGVIVPMIASKKGKGQIIKIGTPLTKNHFFHSCLEDKRYRVINVDWKDAVAAGQYSQDFIDEQRENLLDVEFQSEYCANFADDSLSFFPLSLINRCTENYELISII